MPVKDNVCSISETDLLHNSIQWQRWVSVSVSVHVFVHGSLFFQRCGCYKLKGGNDHQHFWLKLAALGPRQPMKMWHIVSSVFPPKSPSPNVQVHTLPCSGCLNTTLL